MYHVPWHIGDYERDTAHLTGCEDGMYSRLLRLYYSTEKPLPAKIQELQRRVRAHSPDEKAAVVTVLAEFFRKLGGDFHHNRCDEEIAVYLDKVEKAKRAGKLSGAARRMSLNGRSTGVQRTLNGTRTDGQPSKNQEPRTKKTEKARQHGSAVSTVVVRGGGH